VNHECDNASGDDHGYCEVVTHGPPFTRAAYRMARYNTQTTKPTNKPQNSKVLNRPLPAVSITPMTPTISAPASMNTSASLGFVILLSSRESCELTESLAISISQLLTDAAGKHPLE
jgi:hypothetical protein